MNLRALVSPAMVTLLAGAAGAVAWRAGGGAEGLPALPRPVTTTAETTKAGDGYEASSRLVEIASKARFAFPHADNLRGILRAHWRQQKPAFFPVTGDAERFVSALALRTSNTEAQWAMALGEDGGTWAPDARTWNMNEGSYDQREAILAPGPGSVAIRVTVPTGGRFTFAEGTVNAADQATVFVVKIVDARGTIHETYRHALQPSAARRWTDATVDLAEFAGQEVELRLETERAEATDHDAAAASEAVPASAYGGPGNGRPTVDAGFVREEALATPGEAIAAWGNPTILARTTPSVPYNVVWFVIDALRPDVVPSFHDAAEDAAKEAAPWPPLEAMLPRIEGLMPSIDDLAAHGARFTHAYSVASWTRPGTLAMLCGARSSELGIDTTQWMIPPSDIRRFYESDPPLLSLALRKHGVVTRAFVNNYFMAGYAPIGMDMGFERVDDHRYRTRDTLEITADATRWIKENKDTRFFAFVNYNSPHEPYEPPEKHLARVVPPPKDNIARLYMAEAAKDDEAIGVVMHALEEAGLREKTIVIVTADHGETMSSAHVGTSGLEQMPIRYHHAVSNFEETIKVPIVIDAPAIKANTEVKARVRTIDIAPTVLDLLGLEPHPRMSGKSLVPLTKGAEEPERVVVSEGRGTRAVMAGKWRLVTREGLARIVIQGDKRRETDVELFDLVADPGERHDLASQKGDVVAEMRARLDAALKNVPVAGATTATEATKPPVLHLRFTGGAQPRRVSGTMTIDAKAIDIQPIELGKDAWKREGGKIDIALRTSPDAAVGFDLVIDPPSTPVHWDLWLDDKPWPVVFGGPFGLVAPSLLHGITNDASRAAAQAWTLPTIDAKRDVGLFVARERAHDAPASAEGSEEGAEEMARLLKEWGYAKGNK